MAFYKSFMGDGCREATRARQAFVLGWAVTNLGGVNEVIRNLVCEFRRCGPLAPLVIEASRTGSLPGIGPDVPLLGVEFLSPFEPGRAWKSILRFCFYLPPSLLRLYRTCRRYNIEVLNPHFVGLQYFVLVLFRRSGLFRGKLLFSFHGSDARMMMQTQGFERYLCRLLLRGADGLAACSDGLREEIAAFVPECAGRIATIHNGIDADRFLASADPSFTLPERFRARTKLLNVGAFEHKKAHDTLIKAFAHVREHHDDVCLIIAGQRGHRLAATQELIRELGVEKDVLVLVDLPHAQVAALMQLAGMFVLSSRWDKGVCGEGFAMVLLEAAAAGRPVISTESCGVGELLSNGRSGIVVPTGRPDLLAKAIEFFLDNPDEAARQANNLHQEVRQQFTWPAAQQRYLELAGKARPHTGPAPMDGAAGLGYRGVEQTALEQTSATKSVAPAREG